MNAPIPMMVKTVLPHASKGELAIYAIYGLPGLKRVVAPAGKYAIGERVEFWPEGASKDGGTVKARLVYGVFSAGEVEKMQ